MNSSSDNVYFLDEMKINIENKYSSFQNYQKEAARTLAVFHDICERCDITYYLAYGSLLGAIRDGGQIPWDYDIDVWVPLEQRDLLLNALKSSLPPEYHYTTRYIDRDYRTYTLKVCPVEYDCEVLHVDIFWLVGVPSDLQHEVYIKKGLKYLQAMLIKYTEPRYLGLNDIANRWFYKLRKIKYMFYPRFVLEHIYKRLTRQGTQNSEWWSDSGFSVVFRNEWFGEPQKIKLHNGKEYFIPSKPEEVLKAWYGDYMKIPSIEERVSEMNNSLKRLDELALLQNETVHKS